MSMHSMHTYICIHIHMIMYIHVKLYNCMPAVQPNWKDYTKCKQVMCLHNVSHHPSVPIAKNKLE